MVVQGSCPTRRGSFLSRTIVAAAAIATLVAACAATPSANAPDAGPGTSANPAGSAPGTAPIRAVGVRPSAGCAGGTPAPAAGVTDHQRIDVDGTSRAYDITYPAGPAAITAPAPLMFSFHGFSNTAALHESLTKVAAKGSAAGDVVIVPEGAGTPPTWPPDGKGADAHFVDAMIAKVANTRCIDLARVYLSGFSAGSAFAISYTCAHEDSVAALATVAVDFNLGCKKPMSIIAFHGTADEAVPYQDGAIGKSLPGIKVRGTELNMGDWASLAGCTSHSTSPVGAKTTHWVYAGCTAPYEVELFGTEGGGHAWPGAPLEGTTQDVNATDEALAFFARHHT